MKRSREAYLSITIYWLWSIFLGVQVGVKHARVATAILSFALLTLFATQFYFWLKKRLEQRRKPSIVINVSTPLDDSAIKKLNDVLVNFGKQAGKL